MRSFDTPDSCAFLSDAMLEDDFVFPSQLDSVRDCDTGEKRLLFALVVDALNCAYGTAKSMRQSEQQAAQRWFGSSAWRWGSFLHVCQVFGLNPFAVRKCLPATKDDYVRSRTGLITYERVA